MAIRISNEEMDLFSKNGISQEALGRSIDGFRANGLSDNDIQIKIQNKLSSFNQGIAQPKVSTELGTNSSSPNHPQVVQEPVEPTFLEGMGNIANAVKSGVGGFVDTIKANPKQFFADTANALIIEPGKEFFGNALQTDVKKSPWLAMAGGALKGAIELPQNIQNAVADIQDTYSGVQGKHNKWNYTDSIKEAVNNNDIAKFVYDNTVKDPMQNNQGLEMLGEFGGMGSGIVAPIKAGVKLNNMSKVAQQTARINNKLDDVQKAKYAKQVEKLAEKRVNESIKPKSELRKFGDDVALGAVLDSLDGETLEERAGNIVAGGLLGGGLHLGFKGAGKAYQKAKPKVDEAIKNVSEFDWVSKRIAEADSALNTNISDKANELTKQRKEYNDMLAKDNSLARNMDKETSEALELADTLTDAEQNELYRRNLEGDKKFTKKQQREQRKQESIRQQKLAKEAKAQELTQDQKEAKEFFDDLLEQERKDADRPATPLKNESWVSEDINTPKVDETPAKTSEEIPTDDYYAENIPEENLGREITKEEFEALKAEKQPKTYKQKVEERWNKAREEGRIQPSEESQLHKDIKGEIEAKRRSKGRTFEIQREGGDFYFKGEDGTTKVYGKGKKPAYVAEGARDLSKRTVGEENIYEQYGELFEDVVEDGVTKKFLKKGLHEVDANDPLYEYNANESPEFMGWYDSYKKADSKTKNKMLSEKLKSYKTQDEASAFYEKFSEYEMMGNERKRAKKVGDETYDTADVSETERLTKAIEEEDIKYEKAEQVDVESSGFKKLVKNAWNNMYKGGMKSSVTNAKTYIKGSLEVCESHNFQDKYDAIVRQVQDKGLSPKVQEAIINDINAMADEIVAKKNARSAQYKEMRKLNDISYKKHKGNVERNVINKLAQANADGDIALGKRIIDGNNLQYKYLDSNSQKVLTEHYNQSAEKANRKLSRMGAKITYENGNWVVKLDKERARSWARDEVTKKYSWSEKKLQQQLRFLEKDPELGVRRAQDAIKNVVKANKNILTNDIKFAYEQAQKQFKDGKLVETGDTWDRQSSDVDAGERRVRQTMEGLDRISEHDLKESYSPKEIVDIVDNFSNMSAKAIIKFYERFNYTQKNKEFNTYDKLNSLDSHYMKEKGLESVDLSDTNLPSNVYKRVKAIDEFDTIVKENNGELKAGKISNKDYAKYGTDENLKQYAKDYLDKEIIIETCEDTSAGGAFNIKTENMHFYTSYTGKTPMAHIRKHEFRHSQQWKDPSKRELFKEASKLTEEADKLKTAIKETLKKVTSLHKQGELKLVDKKDGSLNKRTIDKLNALLGDDAKAFIEWYNKEKQRKNHPIEVDAENFAKGVNDDTIWSRNTRNNGSESFGESNNGASGTRGNSKRKMDEANAETKSIQEEKVVKFIENEFNQPSKDYEYFESDNAKIRSLRAHHKRLDKSRYDWYNDFTTFDPKQMESRIKKQGGEFGDAVYFLQGNDKSRKVKFGELENDKVVFTGKKQLDTVAEKGTASQSLARVFGIDIRQKAISNRIKFLEEHFSEPKEGYIKVNRNLFANAMLFGKSKAWLETLSKGEKAIKETFTNKEVAEGWVELSNRCEKDGRTLYIPKDMYNASITGEWELPLDYMKTYGKGILSKGQVKGMAKVAGAMLDYYNDRFKRKVLTSSSFFTNNRLGNQIMLMAHASSPAEYFRGIKDAITLKDSDIPSEILESTLAEAVWHETGGGKKSWNPVKNVQDNLQGKNSTKRYFSSNQNNLFDNLVRILDGVLVDTKGMTGLQKAGANAMNIALAVPNAIFKEISGTMMEINAKAERFERKQAFSQTLSKLQRDKVTQTARKMATVKHLIENIKSDDMLRSTVIDKVADILGDYNNFNKFEKNFMKRIIPFYAWNRTILRHSIALCKDNPTKLALIALKTLELHTQDDGLEDYQHGALKTGIYDKTAGKNLVINKTKMIPYATLFDMASGESIGSISPGIKKPIEAVQGEKWFKPSSEIQNKRYKRMSHKGQKGYLDTKTGEFKEGGLPAGARLAYVGKDTLETVYPHIGSPLTKGVLSKDVIDHHNKTGEWRLPDKQYDASLGGFYDGDYIGSYNGKAKKRSAKMKMNLGHQVANRLTGLGLQPEQRKAQKEKWQKQSRKLRGY